MRQVFITGAAGLVGQNLIPALKASGEYRIVAADKHPENTAALRDLHPDIEVIETDLAENGGWEAKIAESELVVFLHAQIGGLDEDEFIRNNIVATEKCLAAVNGGRTEYIVHVSSSVVNSQADDFYTRTKGAQEGLVKASSIPHVVLRPTLMFGWFDRKHLGWLRRFMERVPVFPIPGDGKYLRQPLYAGDFSAIIHSCLQSGIGGNYNISGRRKINYVDLIREIKSTVKARTIILNIPYWLFWSLLKVYALFDRDPPFTTSQLRALATPDIFEVIDWPEIFNVQETPLREALEETFLHPEYSKIELTF
jgi:nucleoside-diphosphate-sugar epimerase